MKTVMRGLTLAASALVCAAASAGDWNQWRGPDRNGTAAGSPALVTTLPTNGLPLLWKTGNIPSGDQGGFGSISVAGDRAYLYVNWKSKEQGASTNAVAKDVFVCLSVADGKILWKTEFPSRLSHWGSSSTPCVSGGRVYGAGDSVIYCLNAADGKLVWQAETKGLSISSSTMLLGDKVIVQAGALTALNAADGAVVWTQPKVKGSNPSPVSWSGGGRSFVIANGGALSCVDAADGAIAWTVPGSGSGTPVVQGDTVVLFGEGKAPGLVAYRMSPDKADLAWSVPAGDRGTTPILHEGHVYAVGANRAICVRLADGRVMWEEKLRYGEISSPVLADGKVIATVEDGGTLMMFLASSGKFELAGKLPRMRAASCASPSVSGGKLFLRLKDGVGCFNLAAPGEAAAGSAGRTAR